MCVAATRFLRLINQQVVHELTALELLTVLLASPTDDSVEVVIEFVKECGYTLNELTPQGLHGSLSGSGASSTRVRLTSACSS